MKKNKLILFLIATCLLSLLTSFSFKFIFKNRSKELPVLSAIISQLEMKPWSGIGGCGAGGSGGGSGDGIKWIGMGVSGGLIDVEMMSRVNFGQNFRNLSISPRFSFKPTSTTTAGLSIPVMSKTGEVQYQSNMEANNRTTGGTGDISLDISKSIGLTGEYSLSVGLTLPSGQYDIKRGSDKSARFLPSSLQKGSGLYNLALGLGRAIDVDDGIWLVDVSYSYPFIIRFFSKDNEFLDEYFSAYKDRTGNRRFYYRAKSYGENDLGAFTPPSLSGSVFFGYRGVPHYVHSWGFTFGAPMGVAWISSEIPEIYDPIPDPDHKAWSAAFIYGIEFSNDKFPLFLAFSLPIHDKANKPGNNKYDSSPMRKWDGPDWDDFGQQWTIAIGLKTTMF